MDTQPSPLQQVAEHPGNARGIRLFVKRDDLLHPQICGSKWRKLAAVLPIVKSAYQGGIVTLGGPFSNHLHAVAAAGQIFEFPTFGIVRGAHANLQNPTLSACRQNGMALFPTSKSDYEALKALPATFFSEKFRDSYFLPEGGSTPEAVRACADIPQEIIAQLAAENDAARQTPLYICVPAGTGCTVAGIVAGLAAQNGRTLIFPVENQGVDEESILRLVRTFRDAEADFVQRFDLVRDYVFGGFAKLHPPMMDFTRAFFRQTGILLDPIYTSKMMFGVFDLLAKNHFPPGSTVVALHTGGLQGWEGFRARYGAAGSV
jgi:1-aminocyclopropane-1-carboxylate deaminase/D-cysteine desulfhydrase-like pyridoxal-dependent ACC family enzyme